MSTTTTTIFKNHESTELSFIDITSSGPNSKFWARCLERGREWGVKSCPKRHPHFLQGTKFSVTCSWYLSPTAFMSARTTVFKYTLLASILLGLRNAYDDCPLTLHMYCLQILTAFLSLSTSRIFVKEIRRGRRERSGYLTPVQEMMKEGKRRGFWNGFNPISLRRLVLLSLLDSKNFILWFTTLCIQTCCVLIVFWDVVFWTGVLKMHHIRLVDFSDGLNVTLLHICNTIPVMFELIFGATIFRPTFCVPSLLFVSTLLWVRFPPVAVGRNDLDLTRFSDLMGIIQGKHSCAIKMTTSARLFILYVAVCLTLFGIQNLRCSSATRKLS